MRSTTTNAGILRSEAATEILESENNPVTRALLNNANFWFMKKFFEKRELPVSDFDLRFFMELMRDIFSEHDVLRRMLAGEKVGQFFEDAEDQGDSLRFEVSGSEPRQIILHERVDVTKRRK
jgi:hypothetical protein